MHRYKTVITLLILFISFNIYQADAQGILRNNGRMQRQGNAGVPDAFKGGDLSQVNVDELTDEQINAIQSQLQTNGMSQEQAEQAALAKGMSPSEWQNFRSRVSRLNGGTLGKKNDSTPEDVSAPERQVVKSNYRVYQKKPNPENGIFGESFFNTPSLSFEPNLRIATPAGYVLGPDDELLVNVSGYQEANLRTAVQPEGTIFIPQVGSIMVNGLTIEQAIARIRDKMANSAYPSLRNGTSRLIVSLSKIRSIHITVIGAAKPGNYTVSSLATVFNSLYMCGGPGDINSFRNIELIRNNRVIQRIDIYQFLTRGDQKGNIPLKENDVINFPVYKKHVTINGQVKRPGIFELKEGENLDNLLFFAGGFTDKAYKATVKVKQMTDTEKKIKDISKTEFSTYLPENGDIFQVDSILDRFENGVAIEGAVYRPGEFELTPNLTVSGLIKRAGGLQENVFTDRAIITRTYPDGKKENITFDARAALNGGPADIKLIKRDSVAIAFATNFKSNYTISVQGEVRKPGQFLFKENLSLKDALFMAGGLTDAASPYHLEVSRRLITNSTQKNTDSIATVFNIDTEKSLSIENERFLLQPYDMVTVRRNPGYTIQQRATINGEVNYPGSYTLKSKNEHISSLLKRAGGLTPLAYNKGVFLIRKSTQKDSINEKSIKNIQSSIRDTSTKVFDDINRTNNRIAINLDKVMNKPGSIEDYALQDGDEIQVLRIDPLIKVNGEVLASTQTGYIKNKGLDYYISQAGGTTDKAKKSKIYVIYANGKISRTHNGLFGVFRSYPNIDAGSEIIVPRKLDKKGLTTTEVVGLTSGLVSLISLIIVTISTLK